MKLERIARQTPQVIAIALLLSCCGFARAQNVNQQAAAATAFVKQTELGEGTAFCIRADGLFVTNCHVLLQLELLSETTLVINSGQGDKQQEVKAKLLSTNLEWDLALLKVDGRNDWPTLDILAENEKLELGDEVLAFGFPFGTLPEGKNPSITRDPGQITSLPQDENGNYTDIKFNAGVNPGNSGGPLVDAEGRVLGVVARKMAFPAVGTSFAISYQRLREFLKQPGLSAANDVSKWEDRNQAMDFQVRVITDFGAVRPDTIEVAVSADGETWRTTQTSLPADKDEVVVHLTPDPRKDLPLLLRRGHSFTKPTEKELLKIDDRVIHGATGTRLSDVARLVRIPNDEASLELRSGRGVKVSVKDLHRGEELLPAATWDSSTVHVDDPRKGAIDCVIRAKIGDQIVREVAMPFVFTQRPPFKNSPGDRPVISENGPVDNFHIQIPLQGQVTFNIGRFGRKTEQDDHYFTGFALAYASGQHTPPGNFSLWGPFIRVNGKMWHYAMAENSSLAPNILSIELKDGEWDCEVARDWAAGAEGKDLQEGEVDIRYPVPNLTMVTLRTPQGKPATYRIRFFLKTAK
ncbi:serine protease [Blastopirellula sp. JC732]|uniref:Serine protease n=1 Tax=Blastopirellula sediminis TaxID=2894196 RepID=A0A9X1MK63_9BACT|nr:serine protease [Blastopirellula sediminis]MCC9609426.1 serine protease [Blastopirellula sediminis]MCC9627797.1 serine protease [Blastopirellula sediminis]